MSIDVVDNAVVSVWTRGDEARLRELLERRERIMSENRGRVVHVLAEAGLISNDKPDELADQLIRSAGALRAALRPFDELATL